jgi:7-cyano-7-deazaguanine synthase in queuosine biosynthesis
VKPPLQHLIYALSRDAFRLRLRQAQSVPDADRKRQARPAFEPDCVCMLSGGLDSLAGAVMLQETGRHPLYVLHRSGNPAVHTAQQHVLGAVQTHWAGDSRAWPCAIGPAPRGARAFDYPPPEEREPSRRCRSLLYMALALAAAEAVGVEDVYMPENGVLTAGLPATPARAGSLSTHSTHPGVTSLMNDVARRLGLVGRLRNPFAYQTKSELIRDVLAPRLSVSEIQRTVSCWAAGRANRQCGGCVPCLLRQFGMAWAELPREAFMVDVLHRPNDYVGADAYGNLVDILRQARQISRESQEQMLSRNPALLSLAAGGLEIAYVTAMLKRHAEQTLQVLHRCYPVAAKLLS